MICRDDDMKGGLSGHLFLLDASGAAIMTRGWAQECPLRHFYKGKGLNGNSLKEKMLHL